MEFEKRKVGWLEYDIFESCPFVIQRTFMRHGGTSEKSFASLNLADNIGDHPDNVKLNREIVRKSMGVSNIAFANQVHGLNIFEVTGKNFADNPGADALFTVEQDIVLAITHADCQAALIFDPKSGAIAALHAGWRGLFGGIYQAVVAYFEKRVKSNPSDLLVSISPSLGPDHAEFKNYKKEIPEKFWDYQVKPFYFNLWDIAKFQLAEAGVKEKNIELSEICTYCSEEDYYSHRRDKLTGRNATCIALKK